MWLQPSHKVPEILMSCSSNGTREIGVMRVSATLRSLIGLGGCIVVPFLLIYRTVRNTSSHPDAMLCCQYYFRLIYCLRLYQYFIILPGSLIQSINLMGNVPNQNQKFKPKRLNKMQVEIACIKAKAHLELVKDRKINELMKDEKALVNMLNAKSRNKIEEVLQAEKVIADLKYIQACTTLMAYANTLKNNCAVIAQCEGNTTRIQQLVPYILSIIYAATHLGLSSLTEFKALMLNYFGTENIQLPMDQVDPKIIEAFKVNSTPFELNTYFIQMSQRNNIPLEQINAIGHNIARHHTGPLPNNPQTNPYQNNQNQQQQIYKGNPYRNSCSFEGPNVPHNNVNPPADNFNYPTQEYNPLGNKGFEFDTKPINIPAYTPYNPVPTNQINNEIAKGFNFNAPVSVKPTTPPAFVPPPKLLQNDPYANLLNINQIDDIPLYPQMERLSVDPNKNKKTPIGDTITLNKSNVPAVSPGGFNFDYNANYLPQYVPFKPDYEPPKNVQSCVYPDANLKDQAKFNQGFNPTSANNPYDNFNPYTGLNDPEFDQICEEIKKGL